MKRRTLKKLQKIVTKVENWKGEVEFTTSLANQNIIIMVTYQNENRFIKRELDIPKEQYEDEREVEVLVDTLIALCKDDIGIK